MNNEQLRNLFNKITSNGMREMTEERFIQAINEANEIERNKPYESYFGWCDVEGCEKGASSGGIIWSKTGFWRVCYKHLDSHKKGEPQPKMKKEAIERENKQDKITEFLKK
jgi:hypothetical protein